MAVRCWVVGGRVRKDLVRDGVVGRVKKGCRWRSWWWWWQRRRRRREGMARESSVY